LLLFTGEGGGSSEPPALCKAVAWPPEVPLDHSTLALPDFILLGGACVLIPGGESRFPVTTSASVFPELFKELSILLEGDGELNSLLIGWDNCGGVDDDDDDDDDVDGEA